MKFQTIKHCHRSVQEQRYIWAMLGAWDSLPEDRRRGLLNLMERLAHSETECAALFMVLVRGQSPETVSAKYFIPVRRLYELRREFYERAAVK